MDAEDRYAMAVAVRLAVNGKPEQFDKLRPVIPRRDGKPPSDTDYDETGLAEELAALGFVEVPTE